MLSIEELHELAGRASAAWTGLEEQLAGLFQILSLSANAYVSFAIFYAPNNTKTRMDMLNAAANISLAGSELQPRWANIKSAANSKLALRNRISHMAPMRAENDDGRTFCGFFYSWLHPSFTKDFDAICTSGIRAHDVEASITATLKLSEKIAILSLDARDALQKRQKHLSTRQPLAPLKAHPSSPNPR